MPKLHFHTAAMREARWELARLLDATLVSLIDAVSDRLKPLNVTIEQCAALLFLHDVETACVGELAVATRTDAVAMSRLIDRLVSMALCSRAYSRRDRRYVELGLTREGARVAECVGSVLDDVLHQYLEGFVPGERDQLVSQLRRMLSNGSRAAAKTDA